MRQHFAALLGAAVLAGGAARTLVGYVEGATLEKDRLYDAYLKFDSNQNLYSLVNDEALNIQGRPTPFEDSDLVPLGIKVATANTYTIAIASTDGLFANQAIYLEDKDLNIIHDLKQAPYTFSTASGRFDQRRTIVDFSQSGFSQIMGRVDV